MARRQLRDLEAAVHMWKKSLLIGRHCYPKTGCARGFRLPRCKGMPRIPLTKFAHARSGDKGNTVNIGLIALKPEYYPILVEQVTAARVQEHFRGICHGKVER